MAGENVIVKQGKAGADFTKIISMNSTAVELYNEFVDKDFSAEEVAAYLVTAYEIEQQRAESDAAAWIEAMKSNGLIL